LNLLLGGEVSFAVFHRSAFLLRSELCNSNGPSFQFQEKQHTPVAEEAPEVQAPGAGQATANA